MREGNIQRVLTELQDTCPHPHRQTTSDKLSAVLEPLVGALHATLHSSAIAI